MKGRIHIYDLRMEKFNQGGMLCQIISCRYIQH